MKHFWLNWVVTGERPSLAIFFSKMIHDKEVCHAILLKTSMTHENEWQLWVLFISDQEDWISEWQFLHHLRDDQSLKGYQWKFLYLEYNQVLYFPSLLTFMRVLRRPSMCVCIVFAYVVSNLSHASTVLLHIDTRFAMDIWWFCSIQSLQSGLSITVFVSKTTIVPIDMRMFCLDIPRYHSHIKDW